MILIILAMSGLAIKLPGRAGTVVVVADRSDSMPPDTDSSHKEAINIIRSAIGGDQRLSVVSFGRASSIEPVSQTAEFPGFINNVGRDESNLSEALEKALSLIPQGSPGRIVILSDGRWTGKDPTNVAWRAAARGISIDYRTLERSAANDLAIFQIEAPGTVSPGESFMINGWISSPISQEINYELLRGNELLAAGKRNVSSGLTRLTFRDQASDPGTYSYRLRVSSAAEDPVPENNIAKLLIGISGPKPLLCLTPAADSGLVRLLTAGGLKVITVTPESFTWSVEELSNYSALIIENVPADKIGLRGMQNIVAWVKETAAGLMITGGKNSYGPGGYYRSELEPIMPVSMELKREHRKLSMAIVVAMDRSGSMAVPVGPGRTKMDLANVAAVQVLDLMSPMDEFGVIAVDSSPHTIVNLAPPVNVSEIRDEILRIDSEGGGIFIYEALAASAKMLLDAKAGTRHIILFADAADSEEPGKYQELIAKCEQAGITISVVGLGKPTDSDANLLRDIARRGGGRIFFTENAEELPRLFAQDTFVVARSTFVDEPTPIEFTGGAVSLTGRQFTNPPSLGGYNLCYLRPEANLGAITVDDYKAPVISSWQAGLGRVLCYTGEADGAYVGALAKWKDAGELFTSLARWTAGETNSLPGNMLITQELKSSTALVQLHLDPERQVEPFNELPGLAVLRGIVGSKPEAEKTSLKWSSADTLEAEIPLRGNQTALATIEVAGAGKHTLSPVCLPYSPEFKPVEPDSGRIALEQLGKATGGRERVSLASVWKDLPRQSRLFEMAPWLLVIVLLSLLAEVLERRTGLVSQRRLARFKVSRAPAEVTAVTLPEKIERKPSVRRWPFKPAQENAPAVRTAQIDSHIMVETSIASTEPEERRKSEPGLEDAMSRARRQARSRTKPRRDVP